jgi:hypothetical protein
MVPNRFLSQRRVNPWLFQVGFEENFEGKLSHRRNRDLIENVYGEIGVKSIVGR